MEEALLASFIPAPSKYALFHEFPKACLTVINKRRMEQLGSNNSHDQVDSTDLLVRGFHMGLETVLELGNSLDYRQHCELIDILVQIMEDTEAAATIIDSGMISMDKLAQWLGVASSENSKELWVCHLFFKMFSYMLVDGGNDAMLNEYMCQYFQHLPLHILRQVGINEVHELCQDLGMDEDHFTNINLCVTSIFIRSSILQRRLDGIKLIRLLLKSSKIGVEFLSNIRLIPTLLSGANVHDEVVNQMKPVVETMALNDSLSVDDLKILNKIPSLMRVAAKILPLGKLQLYVEWVNRNQDQQQVHGGHLSSDFLGALAPRLTGDNAFGQECLDLLWKQKLLNHITRIGNLQLLQSLISRCIDTIQLNDKKQRRTQLFAVRVLCKLWQTPSCALVFDERKERITELFVGRLKSVVSGNEEDHFSFSRAFFSLGTEIVVHDDHHRKALLEHVWEDVFNSKLGTNVDPMFWWISELCEVGALDQPTAISLLQKLQAYMGRTQKERIFTESFFMCLRNLFFLVNEENFLVQEHQPGEENAANMDAADHHHRQLFRPKCDPGYLVGMDELWEVAMNTIHDNVAGMAVETLQSMYDHALDNEQSNDALIVRTGYVEHCIKYLRQRENDHGNFSRNPQRVITTKRCLGFIEALLNEADRYGTRGFRSHGARQRGQIHSLTVSHKEDQIYQLSLYSNATVWDIKSGIIGLRWEYQRYPARVSLEWIRAVENGGPVSLDNSYNSKTLQELGFGLEEFIRFDFTDETKEFEQVPRVRLLDAEGEHLTPMARLAICDIFEDWATVNAELPGTSGTTMLMSDSDFVRLFMFCTEATNMNAISRRSEKVFLTWSTYSDYDDTTKFLSKEDFLRFYENATKSRPLSVWKDLYKHGFDNNLERTQPQVCEGRLTSEFKFFDDDVAAATATMSKNPSPPTTPSHKENVGSAKVNWRAILAESESLYETLFSLLDGQGVGVPESIASWCWTILLRLPSWPEMMQKVKAFENLDSLLSPLKPRQAEYVLHIVVSFMEEDESKKYLQGYDVHTPSVQVEKHIQRARRASFEMPAPEQLKRQNAWTQNFMENGGMELLMNLIELSDDEYGSDDDFYEEFEVGDYENNNTGKRVSTSSSSVSISAGSHLLELALKGIKLMLAFGKIGKESVILDNLATPELLLMRIRKVLDFYYGSYMLDRITVGAAEHALFIWDFVFSWLSRKTEDPLDLANRFGTLDLFVSFQQQEQQFLERQKRESGNFSPSGSSRLSRRKGEAQYATQIWRDSLLDTITRISQRFPKIRDHYIQTLVRNRTIGPLDRSKGRRRASSVTTICDESLNHWMARLLVNLLSLSAKTIPQDAGTSNDEAVFNEQTKSGTGAGTGTKYLKIDQYPELLNSVYAGCVSSRMQDCAILRVIIENGEGDVLEKLGKEKMVQLVTSIAHRLLAPEEVDYKQDMLQLLQAVCVRDQSLAKRVALVVLLPLLRTRDKAAECPSTSSIETKQDDRLGLVNLGNTCYVNSILQQLAGLAPILRIIFSLHDDSGDQIIRELQRTLGFLNRSERSTYNPLGLIEALGINPREQQDCEEFLNALFDLLENYYNDAQNKNKRGSGSWAETFGGSFDVARKCGNCGKETMTMERTGTHVAVDIVHHDSINKSLENGTLDHERLEDFRCPACGVTGQVSQMKDWNSLPPVLIFHLKRFKYDLAIGKKEKLTNSFLFEEMLFENTKRLVGIICHQGSAEGGHYYSYVKQNADWYELNDRLVRKLDGFPTESYQSAYLLFYASIQDICLNRSALIPPQLRSEIDRDNFTLHTCCTFMETDFWDLCAGALLSIVQRKIAAAKKKAQSKRASIGEAAVVEPTWWPSSKIEYDENDPIAIPPPPPPPKASATKSKDVNTFVVFLVRVVVLQNIGGLVKDTVLKSILDSIVSFCLEDPETSLQVIQNVVSVCSSHPAHNSAFYLIWKLYQSIDNLPDDHIVIRKLLFKSDSFVENAVACFNTDSKREYVMKCILFILVGKRMTPEEKSVLGWVFSTDSSFIGRLLEEARFLCTEAEYLESVENLSMINHPCAEMVAIEIAKQVIVTMHSEEEALSNHALKSILAIDDPFVQSRLDAVIAFSQNRDVAFESFMDDAQLERKDDVILWVWDNPTNVAFVCANDAAEPVLVTFAYGNQQVSHQLDPKQRKVIYTAPKPALDNFGWAVTAPENESNRKMLQRSRSEAMVGAGEIMNNKENTSNRQNIPISQHNMKEKIQTIAAMGFSDEKAIAHALEVSRGDEQMALEYLLAGDFQQVSMF